MASESDAHAKIRVEIDKLEQRWAENPKGRVFAHLADAYRKVDENSKAENLILHGLKNHPNYISAYIVLGRVYLDSERFSDAHTQFTRVLELDPQNLIALQNLGDLAMNGGRLEDARSWYERMLQVDPRSEEANQALEMLSGGDLESDAQSAVDEAPAFALPEPAPTLPDATPPMGPGAETWDLSALDSPSEKAPVEGLVPRDDGSPADASAEVETTWDQILDPTVGEPGAPFRGSAEGAPEGSGGGDSELNLDDMKDWTPGFLSEEGGESEAVPDKELFGDLESDVSFDIGVGEPAEARQDSGLDEGSGMVTETMAELYAEQGLYQDALRVYRHLLEQRPKDERLRARIREIEGGLTRDESISAAEVTPETARPPEATEPFAGEDPFALRDPFAAQEASQDSLAASEPPAESPAAEPFAGEDPFAIHDPFAAEESAAAVRPETDPVPMADLTLSNNDGLGEGSFEFAAEAPEAGLGEVDPFAAAFDAPTQAPAPESMFDLADTQPAGMIKPESSAVIEDVVAPPLAEAGARAPQGPAPAISTHVGGDEVETIEDYLTRLLQYDASAASPGDPADPGTGSGPSAPETGAQRDAEDTAQFQDWLKGLKR